MLFIEPKVNLYGFTNLLTYTHTRGFVSSLIFTVSQLTTVVLWEKKRPVNINQVITQYVSFFSHVFHITIQVPKSAIKRGPYNLCIISSEEQTEVSRNLLVWQPLNQIWCPWYRLDVNNIVGMTSEDGGFGIKNTCGHTCMHCVYSVFFFYFLGLDCKSMERFFQNQGFQQHNSIFIFWLAILFKKQL